MSRVFSKWISLFEGLTTAVNVRDGSISNIVDDIVKRTYIKHISFLLTDLLHVTTYSEPSEKFE